MIKIKIDHYFQKTHHERNEELMKMYNYRNTGMKYW